jgi:hypothetical protein
MIWNEVRKAYPNKWIVFDSLKQHEKDNKLIIEKVSVIEVFDDLNDAFKCYRMLRRENKTRELSLGNTKEESLIYEIIRIRLI